MPGRCARDSAVALDARERHTEGRRFEPAPLELEELAQLRLRLEQHVFGARALRGEFRDTVDALDLGTAAARGRDGDARPPGEDPDAHADDQQQDRGLDVVLRVDREREIRAGEEEVERKRGSDARDRAGLPTARDRGEHDDEHEDQREVGALDLVADGDEGAGDENRADDTDRHPEHTSRASVVHDSVVPGGALSTHTLSADLAPREARRGSGAQCCVLAVDDEPASDTGAERV